MSSAAAAAVNVVFGAGGATGLQCVKRLLAATDVPVRAVVRDPSKYEGVLPHHERLSVVAGDVTKPDTVKAACVGASGVIFAASSAGFWQADSVDNKGASNVAAAATEAGASRLVLVSSAKVSPHNRWTLIRLILNNVRWGLMDAKFAGEEAVRRAKIDHCVVRPGGLTNEAGQQSRILVGQGDNGIAGSHRISRADVAAVCVEALTNPAARNVTVEVVSSQGTPGAAPVTVEEAEASVKQMWNGLKQDTK